MEDDFKMDKDTLEFLRQYLTEEELVKLDVLVTSLSEYVATLCVRVRERKRDARIN
jgi:hypothetical protein